MRRRVVPIVAVAVMAIAIVAVMAIGRTRQRSTPERRAPESTVARPAAPWATHDATPGTDKATTPTSTTLTPAITADIGPTDHLEVEHPLVHVLPVATSHYRIDYRVVDSRRLVLTITLRAVLNHADQLADYQARLRQYKAEALDFLRSQNEDPGAFSISYQPPEAAGL